jgi:hypothetical protein
MKLAMRASPQKRFRRTSPRTDPLARWALAAIATLLASGCRERAPVAPDPSQSIRASRPAHWTLPISRVSRDPTRIPGTYALREARDAGRD